MARTLDDGFEKFTDLAIKLIQSRNLLKHDLCDNIALIMQMVRIIWAELTEDEKREWADEGVWLKFKPRHVGLIMYCNSAFNMILDFSFGKSLDYRCETLNDMWSELSPDEIDKWYQKSHGPLSDFPKYELLLLFLEKKKINHIRDVSCCIIRLLLEINAPMTPVLPDPKKIYDC